MVHHNNKFCQMRMRRTLTAVAVLSIVAGCHSRLSDSFDPTAVRHITFTHDAWEDGHLRHYEWSVPGAELQDIFKHLEPDEKNNSLHMRLNPTEASYTYNGETHQM